MIVLIVFPSIIELKRHLLITLLLFMKYLIGFLLTLSSFLLNAQNFEQKVISLKESNSLDKLITAATDKKMLLLGEASQGCCTC